MSRTTRHGRSRWLNWVGACLTSVALAGCGGGGGGGTSAPGADADGPVAGADYFPLNVGDRWLYADGSGSTTQVTVTSTQIVSGATALRVRTLDSSGVTDEAYVKSTSGVTLQPGADADPVLAALGPLQVLRLPIVAGERWTLVDRTLAAVADLDGDGQAESVTVRGEVSVVGFETLATPDGSHAHVAHVRTVLTQSTRLTGSGRAYSATVTSDDWYAPDIGPIRNLVVISGDVQASRTDTQLTGWRVGSRRSDTVPPTLTSQQPATGSTVYGGFPVLQIGFGKAMDTGVPATDIWTLTGPDGQPVAGAAVWQPDGRSLVFSHAEALASGRYTARLRSTAIDLLGNALATEQSWQFTVDASGPSPMLVQPLAGAAEVPLDSTVVIALDEDPDPATVNTSTVGLLDLTAASNVEATVTLSGRTVTLTPKTALRIGGRYQVSVIGVSDLHGNRSGGASWTFTADPGRFAAAQRLIDSNGVTAVAVGDVDGDGRADALMATGYDQGSADGFTLFVRRGLGGGSFAPVQRYATISAYGAEIGSMVVADLDRNGRNAVVVAAAGRGLQVFRQQADGTLASSQVIDTAASAVVRVADMDGDGRPDLVSAPFSGSAVSVWLQGADGRFGSPITVPVVVGSFGDIAVGDLDGDGRPDIAVTSSGGPDQTVGVVLRLADGGYAPAWYPSLAGLAERGVSGVTIGDVTGDGRADLVLAQTYASHVTVLAQRADGGLADPVAVRGASNANRVRVTDLDGNGRNDVLSWSWGGYPVALNRQRSDGSLGAVETWPVADYGIWTPDLAAVGDLDGDGRPDLLYASAWLRQRNVPSAEPPAATQGLTRRATAAGLRGMLSLRPLAGAR